MNISDITILDSMEEYHDAIIVFLQQHGYEQRQAEVMLKNALHTFCNPRIIVEIIIKRYPRLIALSHEITDSSNRSVRLNNWHILNKTLKVLKCDLSDEKIRKIAVKTISKDEVYTFLLTLKVKLDSFEPIYLSRQESDFTSVSKTIKTFDLSSQSTSSIGLDTSFVDSTDELKTTDIIEMLSDQFKTSGRIITSVSNSNINVDENSSVSSVSEIYRKKSILFGKSVVSPFSKTRVTASNRKNSHSDAK